MSHLLRLNWNILKLTLRNHKSDLIVSSNFKCNLCGLHRMVQGLPFYKREFSTIYTYSFSPPSNKGKTKKKRPKKTFTEVIEVSTDKPISETKQSLNRVKANNFHEALISNEISQDSSIISNLTNVSQRMLQFKQEYDHELFDTTFEFKGFQPEELALKSMSEKNEKGLPNNLDVAHPFIGPNEFNESEFHEEIQEPEFLVHSIQTKGSTKSSKRSKKVKLKLEDEEDLTRIKKSDLDKKAKETSMNKSLEAFVELLASTGSAERGLNTLNYYRYRQTQPNSNSKIKTTTPYEYILHGFAAKADIKSVNEVLRLMAEDKLKPSCQAFSAKIECFGRLLFQNPHINYDHDIKSTIEKLQENFFLDNLFDRCVYIKDQREMILSAITRIFPNYVPQITPPKQGYSTPLLKNFSNHKNRAQNRSSEAKNLLSLEELKLLTKEQFEIELHGSITIKSIEKKDMGTDIDHYRDLLRKAEEGWGNAVKESLRRNLNSLYNLAKKNRVLKAVNLNPFIAILPPDEYKNIIIEEIRKLAEGSETYSPSIVQLHRELGAQILRRYQIQAKKDSGILEKVKGLYTDYSKWYLETDEFARNPRQKWQELIFSNDYTGPHVDVEEKSWPGTILISLGNFFYNIIMRDIKIDANIMKKNAKPQIVPAFYSIFRMQGVQLKEEIKPHPALVKLIMAASRDELNFESQLVPMICPPLPWASIRTGGYLLSAAKIVRLPFQAYQQQHRLENSNSQDLYPALDALNQLGTIPWKVNEKVLDIVIQVFNDKGNERLGISPPPSECPPLPSISPEMTKEERFVAAKERLTLKRKRSEMYSLWCDALYKFSLANYFRGKIFWLPHNMDFRGRVYPCPPHLNHIAADAGRSLLVFAQGKPLGPNGLKWLKTHLINLTGLKKRDSLEDRVKYADTIIDEIFDSADNPLNGNKWWQKSEEPWQTLACCFEIAAAIRSGNPEEYICHFPVHQDGSCNGLQHYAALGRDQSGAESVNLAPSKTPQDVYSAVAALVEKLRVKDAENGIKIAQALEGHIKRKVIKQTVMTTVYGVTRYGARQQIAKQLKDLDDFPKEFVWSGSMYLVSKTFESLREMFTSTRNIQDWFTEAAKQISGVSGQNVEWVTPLGLPVVQPYLRPFRKCVDYSNPLKISEIQYNDMFDRPNVMKQKNAFPPNYIHSLDSSHMMLTSLYCQKANITFVSVHDCFWTHPQSVEIMNKVCREQFVALHSQPLLEELSDFLVNRYSYKEKDFSKDGSILDITKSKLNKVLRTVPPKGDFKLESVLDSVYFFS